MARANRNRRSRDDGPGHQSRDKTIASAIAQNPFLKPLYDQHLNIPKSRQHPVYSLTPRNQVPVDISRILDEMISVPSNSVDIDGDEVMTLEPGTLCLNPGPRPITIPIRPAKITQTTPQASSFRNSESAPVSHSTPTNSSAAPKNSSSVSYQERLLHAMLQSLAGAQKNAKDLWTFFYPNQTLPSAYTAYTNDNGMCGYVNGGANWCCCGPSEDAMDWQPEPVIWSQAAVGKI